MTLNRNDQPSKFNQLWQVYCEQTNSHTEYTEACVNFTVEFLSKLIPNLGWSDEQVCYVLSRKPLKIESYSLQKDKVRERLFPGYRGVWCFDLGLNLWGKQGIGTSNIEPILFIIPISIRLTNLENKPYRFTVKITERTPSSLFPCSFEISDENKIEGFEQVASFIYERMRATVIDWINWSIEEQKVQQETSFSITLD